jgi:hypothetical protein
MLSLSAIGNAVQRSAHASGRPLAIRVVGFLERARIHVDDGVQPILVQRDARQVLLHEVARCHASLLQRALHVGNRRLDNREPGQCGWCRGKGQPRQRARG